MKRRIFTLWIMVTAIASNVVAQEKSYLVTEGKQWAVYHDNPVCSAHYPCTTTYQLRGDTVINGKTYKKEWYSYKEDLSDMRPTKCYMREENGKVYRLNGREETLWFDYKAEVGDTICFNQRNHYGRIKSIYDILLPGTDSIKPYKCHEVEIGVLNSSTDRIEFRDGYIRVYEHLGVISSDWEGYGLSNHKFDSYQCPFILLCVHDNDKILYQSYDGCYKEWYNEKPRPTTRRGYGLYYGDSYLYKYTINEAEEVKDSTDFAVWNDKSVIYFDVDSVGTHAFTNATFRQGQTIYFTEKLNFIGADAFTDILMLDDEPAEKNPFGDLCVVFSGNNAPSIEKGSISNYADTTYSITYVVPDLAAYIKEDIQWTYSQLVTIDDFMKGYISPENEISVADSTEIEVNVEGENMDPDGEYVDLTVNARPRKDIPIRIGDGENKDIYSRAPAWMRYTIELKITDTEDKVLYTDAQQCSAYDECEFAVSFARPKNNIIYVYSRSIDQFDRASEWTMSTVNLDTAIETILIPDHEAYYDLQGRKVAHPTRGIYIRNGRKVIME